MGSQASVAAVMIALRRIVRHLRLADREAELSVGLSAAQLYVLHVLAKEPAHSLAELANRTLTDQSSVSTVVAKLVAKRLVVRKPAATDRRRQELSLTAAGARLASTAPHVPQTRVAEIVGQLPASRRAELVRSLELLSVAIGAADTEPRMLFEDEPRRARSRRRVRR